MQHDKKQHDPKHHAKKLRSLATRFRVSDGGKFRLKDFDPGDDGGLGKALKQRPDEMLAASKAKIAELQDKLYAQDRWALLLLFQAMDAAGKDGTIKHVMSGVNPQGCRVYSFKAPSAEELDHDFLWRAECRLPERGHIGIFNRSYYEEVLVVRVHPELLQKQHLPEELAGGNIWRERFRDIARFERYLERNGIVPCKFFLNVSRKEQRRRFLARLEEPEKNWKFSAADVREREYWDQYQSAYEEMIRHTATEHAPWFVVPADNKTVTHLAVSSVIVHTLEKMKLAYPEVSAAERRALAAARRKLMAER